MDLKVKDSQRRAFLHYNPFFWSSILSTVCIKLSDLFSIFGISCGRDHYIAAEGEGVTFFDVEDVTTASITLLFQHRRVYTPLDRILSGLCCARQDRTFREAFS
jgi:hypothetical protein